MGTSAICDIESNSGPSRVAAEEATLARRWTEAARLWQEISLLPSGSPDDFLRFGETALQAGLFDDAAATLAIGLTRFPGNIWLGRNWALAAKWPGKFSEAADRFSIVRQAADADFLAADHAECLFEAGRVEEAERIISGALESFPTSRWVLLAWARLAARQRIPGETERRWKEIKGRLVSDLTDRQQDEHLLTEECRSLLDAGAYKAARLPLQELNATPKSRSVAIGPATTGVVLSRAPLIIVSAPYSFEPLVRPVMELAGNDGRPVFFFLGSNMSLLFHRELRERLPKQFHDLSSEFPNAYITFLANEVDELFLARQLGMRAELVNNNTFVDTANYVIDSSIEKRFDAVYNARFMPYKRHELALDVASLRLVMASSSGGAFSAHRAAAGAMFPYAEINDFELNTKQVVSALNSSRCGLCLSAGEGAMYAAIEYLLCGLPIVTTWNVGGRDWWLSGDYAIWCDPDAGAVAAGVKSIVEREISPDRIRETAIQRIKRERLNFFSVVEAALAKNEINGLDVPALFHKVFTDKMNYQVHPLSYFFFD